MSLPGIPEPNQSRTQEGNHASNRQEGCRSRYLVNAPAIHRHLRPTAGAWRQTIGLSQSANVPRHAAQPSRSASGPRRTAIASRSRHSTRLVAARHCSSGRWCDVSDDVTRQYPKRTTPCCTISCVTQAGDLPALRHGDPAKWSCRASRMGRLSTPTPAAASHLRPTVMTAPTFTAIQQATHTRLVRAAQRCQRLHNWWLRPASRLQADHAVRLRQHRADPVR